MDLTLENYLRQSAADGVLAHMLAVKPVKDGHRVRFILLRDNSAGGVYGLPLVVLSGNVIATDELPQPADNSPSDDLQSPPAAAGDHTDTDAEA